MLSDAEFEAKPSVLLIGQYSVGKTTFIRQLIGQDFPGQRIGPEPTTDRFVAISHAASPKVVPGNACVVQVLAHSVGIVCRRAPPRVCTAQHSELAPVCSQPNTPYRSLSRFGVEFLNKFEGSQCPAKFLESVTLIDTPGVLAGEKHTAGRGYHFEKVRERRGQMGGGGGWVMRRWVAMPLRCPAVSRGASQCRAAHTARVTGAWRRSSSGSPTAAT
eukprot:COSAG01_NODE_8320_length_2831_cov_2.616032_3_plen_217_part_00